MARARRPSKPSLNLRAAEAVFSVKKTDLLERLGLFQENPSLLKAEEYEVQTRVPLSVLESFVRMVVGGPTTGSDESLLSFRLLCEEFLFKALSEECAAFSDRSLAKRLSALEERILFLERKSATVTSAVQSVSGKMTFLEAEQLYRQGCEYFYGTNGFGLNAKALGLSLLKGSADMGHSDAQYRYGNCLLHGEGCEKDEI
jgi:TPR repeat protein